MHPKTETLLLFLLIVIKVIIYLSPKINKTFKKVPMFETLSGNCFDLYKAEICFNFGGYKKLKCLELE